MLSVTGRLAAVMQFWEAKTYIFRVVLGDTEELVKRHCDKWVGGAATAKVVASGNWSSAVDGAKLGMKVLRHVM